MRRPRLGQRGMTTFVVIILILAVVPLLVMVLRNSSSQLLGGRMDKHIKGSRVLAADFVTDVIRQFSEDYSVDHYDPFTLDRRRTDSLRSGFGGVSLTGDASGRFVVFHSTAEVGVGNELGSSNWARPVGVRRRTMGIIKFVSDHARYAMLLPETAVAGDTYVINQRQRIDGGLWVNGNLRVSAADVDFGARDGVCAPVLVDGDVTLDTGDTEFDCPLYYTGRLIGGADFDQGHQHFESLPRMTVPDLRYAYFHNASAFRRTAGDGNQTWTLRGDTADPTSANDDYTIVDFNNGATVRLPHRAIVLVENVDLTITGNSTVAGRVLIVALRDASSVAGGRVTIQGDIQYLGANPRRADMYHSFGVIATNRITFRNQNNNDDMNVVGLYMTSAIHDGSPAILASNEGLYWQSPLPDDDSDFRLDGAVLSPFSIDPDPVTNAADPFSDGRRIVHDRGLMRFLPPAIPERPALVSVQYSS